MKRMVTDMKHGMMTRMDTKMINAADKEKNPQRQGTSR